MKIEHRILATLLVVMLSCGLLTGCGGSEQESVTLTVAHVLNETHPYHLAWLKVAELVEERTDGGLRLEVFANGTLGNERDIIEGMQLGIVDISCMSTGALASFSPASCMQCLRRGHAQGSAPGGSRSSESQDGCHSGGGGADKDVRGRQNHRLYR